MTTVEVVSLVGLAITAGSGLVAGGRLQNQVSANKEALVKQAADAKESFERLDRDKASKEFVLGVEKRLDELKDELRTGISDIKAMLRSSGGGT